MAPTWHVTLPMISGAIYFIVIVDTIAAFQSFTEAYTAFFGAGNTTYSNDAALFYAIYLFQQAFEFLHMGYASAMAMAALPHRHGRHRRAGLARPSGSSTTEGEQTMTAVDTPAPAEHVRTTVSAEIGAGDAPGRRPGEPSATGRVARVLVGARAGRRDDRLHLPVRLAGQRLASSRAATSSTTG